MKIISKNGQKDFYDYLVGIYGEDPKIVLDRRDSKSYSGNSIGRKRLHFCGMVYDVYCDGKDFHYMEDIRKFDMDNDDRYKNKRKYRWMLSDVKDRSNHIFIKEEYSNRGVIYYTKPYFDKERLNEINNCPSLIVDYSAGGIYKYPNLGDINFQSVMSPSDTFISINNWLSNQIDKSLEVKDNLSDLEKIENKGFDKKISFRPKIKK